MLTLIEVYNAALIAVVAFTFSVLMTDQGDIFAWYYQLLDKMKMKKRWYSHFANPLGWCEKCSAGQIAFWYYIYTSVFGNHDYRLDGHIAFVCLAVFLTVVIRKFKLK